jgi:hypothetical protein
MGIRITHIITVMDITLMTTSRSIMILTAFVISAMTVTSIVTTVATLVTVMVGKVTLDRQAQGRAF